MKVETEGSVVCVESPVDYSPCDAAEDTSIVTQHKELEETANSSGLAADDRYCCTPVEAKCTFLEKEKTAHQRFMPLLLRRRDTVAMDEDKDDPFSGIPELTLDAHKELQNSNLQETEPQEASSVAPSAAEAALVTTSGRWPTRDRAGL